MAWRKKPIYNKKDIYSNIRPELTTGDLIYYPTAYTGSIVDGGYGAIVSTLTRHEISHVGVVIRLKDRVFLVEAVPHRVRLVPLSLKESFIVAKTGPLDPGIDDDDYILSYIGNVYGYIDAVTVFISDQLNTDKKNVICTEVSLNILRNVCKDIRPYSYVPGKQYDRVARHYDTISVEVT